MFRAARTISYALVAVALSVTACGPDGVSNPLSPTTDAIAISESAGLITSPSGVVFLADEWTALEDKTPYMIPREKWEAQHSTPNMKMAYSVTGQVGPKVLCHQFAGICNRISGLIPGSTVVFWTDAQWLSATTNDFKQFDIIYLHDAFGGRTNLAPAKNVWGAAISGRAVLTGTHFEHCGGTTGGPCVALRAALSWIHSGTGTGLLASTQSAQNSANVMIPSIAPFNGITYQANGGGYDIVHITEPGHLTMQGSTDASLSNFGNSSHSYFRTIGSFTNVANVCSVGGFYPNACNGTMQPYYIVTSVSIADQDGDGVPDASDNCPTVANADQADANGNGVGDRCESAPSVVIAPKLSTVAAGTSVTFTTTAADADNALSTLRYEWRVNGIIQANTTATFTYVANADATIRVTVKDPGELSGFDEAKVTVRIGDQTPPDVTPVVTGTLGTNGWYTSDISISWTVTDGESAITSPACTPTTVTTDTNSATFSCTATSDGGTTTKSVTVKRDATIPVVTPTVSGVMGNGGWYTSDVSVSWSVANGPSGATSNCVASTLSSNTASQTYTCSATSGAGLGGSGTVTVKRDNSAPTVTPTVTGTMGSNGWYTSDVSVSWSVIANGPSEASSACVVSTQSTDTNGVTYDCSATSGAGIPSSTSVSFKRDATNPTIGYTGNAVTYTLDQTVAITCSYGDGMSGVATQTCANINGSAYNFGLGAHTYSASVTDDAGNTSTATTTFTVKATAVSLCTMTKLFVTGPGEAGIENSLCTKLEKGNYAPYINEVQAQSGKKISASNAALLILWAQSL